MINKTLLIQNKLGLHARAAAKLVKTANKFGAKITAKKGEEAINAKSIMGAMMLGAAKGTELTFEIEGEDEQAACEAIEALLNDKFGEEE